MIFYFEYWYYVALSLNDTLRWNLSLKFLEKYLNLLTANEQTFIFNKEDYLDKKCKLFTEVESLV